MKTITFYSYKGGVGRSLGLATTAMWLAEEMGQKVCVMDFDLEAPGLHYKFAQAEKEGEIQTRIMNTEGIVEYLDEFNETKALPESFERFYTNLPVKQGEINYMPAGRLNDLNYWNKLFKINWHEFFKRDEQTGLSEGTLLLLSLKDRIEKEIKPDFLLIDSRTGLTEIASITLKLFADKAILFGVNNPENIIGLKWILQSLQADQMSRDLPLYFVISRLPLTNLGAINPQEQIVIENFKSQFEPILTKKIDGFFIIHADNELAWKEQIESDYTTTDFTKAILKKDYWVLFSKIFEYTIPEYEWKQFQIKQKAFGEFNECLMPLLTNRQKLKKLKNAIEAKSDEAIFYVKRFEIYNNLKQFALAEDDLRKALTLQPQNQDFIDTFEKFILDSKNLKLEQVSNVKTHIPIKSERFKNFYESINIEDIIYLEGDINYTIFHLNKKGRKVHPSTLKRHEEILKEYEKNLSFFSFFRISNRYLINIKFLNDLYYDIDGATATMSNGNTLKVSRRQAASFRKAFRNYLIKKSTS